MSESIRLTKRIAQSGKYSRHEADKLVAAGKVLVNGVVAVSGAKISSNGDEVIVVDGAPLGEKNEAVYKFYKPRGVLSTYGDPAGRRNLSDFPQLAKSKMGYSGRLDNESEGLILFTPNGTLIQKLQRKEFEAEKEYFVITDCEISSEWLELLRAGIEDNGDFFIPCQVYHVGHNEYKVILTEGKKRQVRRMFLRAGAKVQRLIRVRICNITLEGLPKGRLVKLTDKETKELLVCIE